MSGVGDVDSDCWVLSVWLETWGNTVTVVWDLPVSDREGTIVVR